MLYGEKHMNTQAETLFGKIAGEILLGKIRPYPHASEPYYMQRVRYLMQQVKKSLGDEAFDKMTEELRPAAHAFADALFDQLTDTDSPKTKKAFASLSIQQQFMVEHAVQALTGGLDHRGPGRWNDELWEARKRLRYMTDMSITGATLQELREGFDSFVHALVDQVWDNRKTLVS